MKVTYNWLEDFVDIRMPAQSLAEKLTMAGLEVASLKEKDGDFVFEIEVTSNRPDCLSVIGIAREVSAITGKKIRLDSQFLIFDSRKDKHRASSIEPLKLKINIENKKDCPLYTARIIKGIQVSPSPDWLKKRLELVGLRSANNIVDIANYILWETGQPLHAFDLDKISDGIIFVRRAKESEKIISIDGEKRNLTREVLVIADKNNPVAVAGIMGSQTSEVTQKTKDILLESAVFNPIVTRRASRILGLSSESSYRFERGVDAENLEFASLRAASLILKVSGGELILSKTTPKLKAKTKSITLKPKQVNCILGADYASGKIEKILASLSFLVKRQGRDFKINVPSFRVDINQPVDLIEEIARIAGYGNIPTRLPKMIPQMEISSSWQRVREVKDILISQGLNEVITYSLISKNLAHESGYPDAQLITIANPLTKQQEILRPSLIPGLISCIGYNLNQKQRNIRIFEICNSFRFKQEQLFLGLACSGREFNLLHIKGILELLLGRLGIADFEFLKAHGDYPFFGKRASLSLVLNPVRKVSPNDIGFSNGVNKRICANLGTIKTDILKKFDIKDSIFAAEVNLEILFAQTQKTQKKYIPIPLYPQVARDISIALKDNIPIGDVTKRIKSKRIPYLVELNFKDYYLGRQIPFGYKGLTLSCIYRASDHTLTAQEADIAHKNVLDILRNEFRAQQR